MGNTVSLGFLLSNFPKYCWWQGNTIKMKLWKCLFYKHEIHGHTYVLLHRWFCLLDVVTEVCIFLHCHFCCGTIRHSEPNSSPAGLVGGFVQLQSSACPDAGKRGQSKGNESVACNRTAAFVPGALPIPAALQSATSHSGGGRALSVPAGGCFFTALHRAT